jgi:hypothetical protein
LIFIDFFVKPEMARRRHALSAVECRKVWRHVLFIKTQHQLGAPGCSPKQGIGVAFRVSVGSPEGLKNSFKNLIDIETFPAV